MLVLFIPIVLSSAIRSFSRSRNSSSCRPGIDQGVMLRGYIRSALKGNRVLLDSNDVRLLYRINCRVSTFHR